MERNKTLKRARFSVWLLLAAVAGLLAWVVGYYAEKEVWHRHFQANSISVRRVLSFFYLGCQVIKKKIKIPLPTSNTIFFEEAEV